MRMNPILKNEMKLNLRTMRSAWTVFIYNGILAFLSLAIFYQMVDNIRYGSTEYTAMIQLYVVMAYIEFGMLMFLLPPLTGGSISGERERQTLDILMTTKIRPWEIITGKLESSLSTVFMLAFSSLPIMSLVFAYGGIGFSDLLILILTLLLSAVFFGSIGIFFSAYCKKSSAAVVITYIVLLTILAGSYFFVKGVYHIQYLQAMKLPEYIGPDLGCLFYVLLINPLIGFFGLISAQVGDNQAILNLANLFGNFSEDFVVQNWIIVSSVIQLVLTVILLYFAARKIDPLRK